MLLARPARPATAVSLPAPSRCSPRRLPALRRPLVRPARRQGGKAFSALPFLGGGGDKDGGGAAEALHERVLVAEDGAEAATPSPATSEMQSEVDQLRREVGALKDRMEEIGAQLEQMNDRARERAVSLASAVKAAAEGGDAAGIEALQHQQDDQLQEDEKSWETMMDTFTQVMSKGYISSVEKIRDRLMISEWELNKKSYAMRKGVANFELQCAHDKVDLPYEVLSQLYQDPCGLDNIADPHLRMHARACVNQAADEEHAKTYAHCTAEAQKLASQFSQSEFLTKLLPESGIVDALKKVVPMAVKMVL